jgi:5-methylcytosine-specific restriction endonuclease McrA
MNETTNHPLATRSAKIQFNKAMRRNDNPARVCGRCLTVKHRDQFPANARKADGVDTAKCLECKRAYSEARSQDPKVREREREYDAARHEANRQRPLDLGDGHLPKRCTTVTNGGCERDLTRGDFPRRRRAADQRAQLCRDCQSRRDAERHLRKKLGLLALWEDREALSCVVCELPVDPDEEWHVDHIVPRSAGGTDDPANIAVAHGECNLAKATDPALAAWARRMELRGEDPYALAALADTLVTMRGAYVDVATGELLEDYNMAATLAT